MNAVRIKTSWPIFTSLVFLFLIPGWFVLRGIDFGLPDLFHNDEHFIVEQAVTVASGNMHLTWFDWPGSTLIYTNASAFAIFSAVHNLVAHAHFTPREWFRADHSDFYMLARMQTALFAFGVLALTILIGKTWKNFQTGIIAAAFLGTSFLLTRHAHYITPDVPLAFFLLSATYSGLRIGESGDRKWYILGGIAVGLGIMTKYTGVAGIIPVLFGHVIYTRRLVTRDLLFFGGVTLLAITIASPYVWIELPRVVSSIAKVAGAEHVGRDALNIGERARFYKRALFTGSGNFIFIAACYDIIAVLFKRHWTSLLLAATALFYFLGIVSLGIVWERYMVPLAPLIALFAADAFTAKASSIRGKRERLISPGVVALVLILPSLTRSLIMSEIFARTQNDTRFQARAWVEKNLPEGTMIAQEGQTPRLSVQRYHTETVQYLSMRALADYEARGVQYVIASSEMDDRFFASDSAEYDDERAFYTALFQTRERVFRAEGNESGFRGVIGRDDLDVVWWLATDSPSLRTMVTGPDISIYKL